MGAWVTGAAWGMDVTENGKLPACENMDPGPAEIAGGSGGAALKPGTPSVCGFSL